MHRSIGYNICHSVFTHVSQAPQRSSISPICESESLKPRSWNGNDAATISQVSHFGLGVNFKAPLLCYAREGPVRSQDGHGTMGHAGMAWVVWVSSCALVFRSD
jgi:hypothetical protein